MAALSRSCADNQSKISSVIDLIERQGSVVKQRQTSSSDDPFIFSIKKVYVKANRGTEVTGVIERGRIVKGDTVDIVGYDKTFRSVVMNIESFRRVQSEAGQGDSAALLLKSVKKDDVCRGMIVTSSNNLDLSECKSRIQLPTAGDETLARHDHQIHLSDHLAADIELLDRPDNPKAKPLPSTNSHLILFGRTFDTRALIRFGDSSADAHRPGDRFEANVKLLKSMAVTLHQPFVLRDAHQTVALGRVKQILSTSNFGEREFNLKSTGRSKP
jgi:elongation factor Tu